MTELYKIVRKDGYNELIVNINQWNEEIYRQYEGIDFYVLHKRRVDQQEFYVYRSEKIARALQEALSNKKRVKIWYGSQQDGKVDPCVNILDCKAWVVTLEISPGKIPLIVGKVRKNSKSFTLLDFEKIIRIDTKSKTLYRHIKFHTPFYLDDNKVKVFASRYGLVYQGNKAKDFYKFLTGKTFRLV